MDIIISYSPNPAEDDIHAVNQLNRLRSVLPENKLQVFHKLGDYYVGQIMRGIYRADGIERYCDDSLKQMASENDIDLCQILKNLPQAAWLYITRHCPDVLDSLASSHETRQAVIADVISQFFGCNG